MDGTLPFELCGGTVPLWLKCNLYSLLDLFQNVMLLGGFTTLAQNLKTLNPVGGITQFRQHNNTSWRNILTVNTTGAQCSIMFALLTVHFARGFQFSGRKDVNRSLPHEVQFTGESVLCTRIPFLFLAECSNCPRAEGCIALVYNRKTLLLSRGKYRNLTQIREWTQENPWRIFPIRVSLKLYTMTLTSNSQTLSHRDHFNNGWKAWINSNP